MRDSGWNVSKALKEIQSGGLELPGERRLGGGWEHLPLDFVIEISNLQLNSGQVS